MDIGRAGTRQARAARRAEAGTGAGAGEEGQGEPCEEQYREGDDSTVFGDARKGGWWLNSGVWQTVERGDEVVAMTDYDKGPRWFVCADRISLVEKLNIVRCKTILQPKQIKTCCKLWV